MKNKLIIQAFRTLVKIKLCKRYVWLLENAVQFDMSLFLSPERACLQSWAKWFDSPKLDCGANKKIATKVAGSLWKIPISLQKLSVVLCRQIWQKVYHFLLSFSTDDMQYQWLGKIPSRIGKWILGFWKLPFCNGMCFLRVVRSPVAHYIIFCFLTFESEGQK